MAFLPCANCSRPCEYNESNGGILVCPECSGLTRISPESKPRQARSLKRSHRVVQSVNPALLNPEISRTLPDWVVCIKCNSHQVEHFSDNWERKNPYSTVPFPDIGLLACRECDSAFTLEDVLEHRRQLEQLERFKATVWKYYLTASLASWIALFLFFAKPMIATGCSVATMLTYKLLSKRLVGLLEAPFNYWTGKRRMHAVVTFLVLQPLVLIFGVGHAWERIKKTTT